MADGIELATGYVSIVTDASKVPKELGRAFGAAGADAGETAGEAAGGGIADKLKSMGGKAGPIAAAIGVIGLAAGGILVSSISAGMERERIADVTQAKLGVDDTVMRKLGTAAGRSYTAAFGESVQENMEVAASAMQAGLFDADAPVAEIEYVINSLQGVNELIGGDIAESTKAVSNLLKNGLADSADEAFDLLASSARTNGLANEDLLESVNQYANGWKNAGFTGAQAFALIAQSIEKGAPDTDRAGDALREFGRRVTEEGETIVETLDGIGLNGTEMFEAFKKGGPEGFAAFDEAFDKIRAIEDPTERNAAAMALLGDTAGDFIDSLANWDPSAAMEKFGDTAGAAENAIGVMGDNAASSLESAKRSIEVSMTGVQNSLAQAFGPTLEKVATWVQTHQPEITGFFIKVGEAAFTLGDLLLLWSSNTLSNLATFVRGLGGLLEGILDPLGTVAVAIGKITGSKDIENVGTELKNFEDRLNGAADSMEGIATAIDEKGRPALKNMRETFTTTAEEAKNAQLVTRALGDEVTALPNGKSIVIDSNTPEQTAALESLGLKVTKLPDGRFEVTANTAEAQTTLDGWIKQNGGRTVTTKIDADTTAAEQKLNTFITQNANGRAVNVGVNAQILGITPQADGGILSFANGKLPDQAMIQPGRGGGLVQWAEGSTGGEAFIPLALAKRDRSLAIWAEVGRRLGVESFAGGGIRETLDWVRGAAGSPYQYGGVGSPSWDCSGIHSDVWAKLTGRPTGTRYFTTESDFEAMGWKPGLGGPNDYSIGIERGGGGPNSHMAGTLAGTNIESSGTDGVEVGAGAKGAADFPLQYYWPMSGDPGGASGGGSGAGTSGGGSGAGTSGGGGGGLTAPGTGTGTDAGSATNPVHVWVDNLGAGTSLGTGTTSTGTGASTTPALTDTDTGDSSTTTGTTTTEQQTHPLQGLALSGDLFNGSAPWYMASSPEQALTNLSAQAATQLTETQSDIQSFFQDNWKEMLSTGAGLLGMGAQATGGTVMNVTNNGMDPNSAAAAVERVVRRRNLATMRSGGMGR
ncbi:phage tail tape measure protein [Nocardia thailandica]